MTSFNLYHLLTGSKSKKVTLRVKTSTYEFLENTVWSRDGRTREKIALHGPKAPVVLRLLECSCVAAVLLPTYRKLCTCIPRLHRSTEARDATTAAAAAEAGAYKCCAANSAAETAAWAGTQEPTCVCLLLLLPRSAATSRRKWFLSPSTSPNFPFNASHEAQAGPKCKLSGKRIWEISFANFQPAVIQRRQEWGGEPTAI